MKCMHLLATLAALALTSTAAAQTKISGTADCGKPEATHSLEVGDRPGHMLAVSQYKCTWTQPWEIAGVQNKEGVGTETGDITGDRGRSRGYYVDTMANGDKAFYRYQNQVSLKDGNPQTSEAQWTLVGGTGKLKGVKGKGVCHGKGKPDGGGLDQCEGEYELPK